MQQVELPGLPELTARPCIHCGLTDSCRYAPHMSCMVAGDQQPVRLPHSIQARIDEALAPLMLHVSRLKDTYGQSAYREVELGFTHEP